jgi:hypothetical protein
MLKSRLFTSTLGTRRELIQKKTEKGQPGVVTIPLPQFGILPNPSAVLGAAASTAASPSNSVDVNARGADSRTPAIRGSRSSNDASRQGTVGENPPPAAGESAEETEKPSYLSFLVNLGEKLGDDERNGQANPNEEIADPIGLTPTPSLSNSAEAPDLIGTSASGRVTDTAEPRSELVGSPIVRSKTTNLNPRSAINLLRSNHDQESVASRTRAAISSTEDYERHGENSTSSETQTLDPAHTPALRRIIFADSQTPHTGKPETNENSESQLDFPGTTVDMAFAAAGRASDPTLIKSPSDNESSQAREEQTPPMPPMPSLPRALQLGSTSQIAIRLDSDDSAGQVELRIRERAGEVQIAVRSTDPSLAGSLRQDLGDLVKRLDPHSAASDATLPQASNFEETSRPESRHGLRGYSPNGYSVPDGEQQRQRQQQQHQHNQRQNSPTATNRSDFDGLEDLSDIINQLRNGVSLS